jgi:hypothetical protein
MSTYREKALSYLTIVRLSDKLLVVENRGRVPARDINIILVDLEYDIQELRMPGPHEKANTTWNPNNPTNGATIEMERLSPDSSLSIYLRTSGPVTLAEGKTLTIVSDRGKARASARVEFVDPFSFWFGVAVAGIAGFVAFRVGAWWGTVSMMWKKQEQWIQTALEWAANGRKDSLRRANLQGADLRGVDLGPGETGGKGADLSYSNLRGADLKGARLGGANLIWADLAGAKLASARYDQNTQWPKGFTPTPGAIKVEDDGRHD